MLKFVFLTDAFYNDYSSCAEIEKKKDRPHAQVTITVGGNLFCIPFRSHIMHDYALFTDKDSRCGLDFSKTVVVTDPEKYIDKQRKPFLRPNEFAAIKEISEYAVSRRLAFYISQYKKAKLQPEQQRNALLLRYSTLKYFEEYI